MNYNREILSTHLGAFQPFGPFIALQRAPQPHVQYSSMGWGGVVDGGDDDDDIGDDDIGDCGDDYDEGIDNDDGGNDDDEDGDDGLLSFIVLH